MEGSPGDGGHIGEDNGARRVPRNEARCRGTRAPLERDSGVLTTHLLNYKVLRVSGDMRGKHCFK